MFKPKPNQSVKDVVQNIKDSGYQLPSIQRPFVWEPEQMLRLLDSIMCGYPIGALMVWLPPKEKGIRCRSFLKEYRPGQRTYSQSPPPGDEQAYMVLDGQQRLQSLYMSFYGTYDGKKMYLRIDSMASETEDNLHYKFDLLTDAEARAEPAYVHLSELTKLDIEEIDGFVHDRLPSADAATRKLAVRIVSSFVSRFVVKDTLLFQEVNEKLGYNDVLEVFERVNSGGTPLSRSDLLFSTLKFQKEDMEEGFGQLVDDLNEGGRHNFNTDFIIKTTFIVFGKKAKYDFEKLSDNTYATSLDTDFAKLEEVFTHLRVWLADRAMIKSGRFLRSKLALIPLIDYLMMNDKHLGPSEGEESQRMRQYLYMSFFARLYSRAPDSPLDQIHDILLKAKTVTPGVFPIDEIGELMARREKKGGFQFRDEYLWDLDLVLNIIDGGVTEIPEKRGWSLERDHIFPRHQLCQLGIGKDVDDIGNLRLLGKSRNISKSDKMPDANTEFFGKDDLELQKAYQAACSGLTQTTFSEFVGKRRELIRKRVVTFLGFPAA